MVKKRSVEIFNIGFKKSHVVTHRRSFTGVLDADLSNDNRFVFFDNQIVNINSRNGLTITVYEGASVYRFPVININVLKKTVVLTNHNLVGVVYTLSGRPGTFFTLFPIVFSERYFARKIPPSE